MQTEQELQQEIDEVLAELEYDPEGRTLLLQLIGAFEKIFGFTPSRRKMLEYLARADTIAAEHIDYLDDAERTH